MLQTIEELSNKLQHQLYKIGEEAAQWRLENREKVSVKMEEEKAQRRKLVKDYRNQLVDIKNKREMIQKYYMAFYADASLSVQVNTEFEPCPVDMSFYKTQMVNMNRRQAADKIIAMAKSNLEFLNQYQEELEEQIVVLEKKEKESSYQQNQKELDTQEKNLFLSKYRSLSKSRDFLKLVECAKNIQKSFEMSNWESFVYEPPKQRCENIMIGTALKSFVFPKEIDCELCGLSGWVEGKGLKVPVSIPMTGFHLLVNYHVSQAQETKEGIRTLLGNILRNIPAKSVRIYPIDLETLNAGAFGSVSLLSGPNLAFMAPCPDTNEKVYELLQEVYNDAVKTSGLLVGYRDVEEYNEVVSEKEKINHKILVLYGCPEKMDHKVVELFQKIYYMSGQCGISIVAIHNSNSEIGPGAARALYQNMKEDALVIESTSEEQYISYDERKEVFQWQTGLTMLSKETIEKVQAAFKVEEVVEESEPADAYFEEINHVRGNKRLNLAFGINERKKVQRFPFEGMNFAAYVSGSAGCGKSSLLHTFIASMLLNCHPEDLELWLVDFKMTEFQMYAKNMPPHVKRVVLEASEEVVLDIIDELTVLMEHRAKLFGKYGIKDMIKLPAEFKYKHLPLVVIIVDEFATMTQIIRNAPIRGALTYAEKLENLLAKGRALGFRFIFSDQAYEKGIAGLTEKSKNQIASRFAMANVSQEEMRGTLAVPNTFLTDQIRNWMASLPPYFALTSEQEDIPGTLEKKTVVHRNKVIFVPSDKINAIIDEVNKRYHAVSSPKLVTDSTYLDKNPLVIDGRRMYTFKEVESEIVKWDETQDYMEETMRLYLGRPCALKKQWPIELTQTPGENLLTIVEDYDKAASVVLSAMQSVSSPKMRVVRDSAEVTILAYRQDKMYHRYRHRWDKKHCLNELHEICQKISELREKVEKKIWGNELIVCFGMYNLYQEWEELPKKKKKTERMSSADVQEIDSVTAITQFKTVSPLVAKLKGNKGFEENDIDDLPDLPEFDFGFENPMKKTKEITKEIVFTDDEMLYNAIEDFEYLLTKGPAKGYHFLVTLSKHSEYKELRWKDKMFRHLVYDNLARDELSDIMGLGRNARVPMGAVRYMSKQEGFSMRPYLWKGLIINGWMMDENGKAVEAGDEDDEFM